MDEISKKLGNALKRIRDENPLVHNITNYVVMNYTANVLLAMGASPVMAHSENEVEEMAALSSALVFNIGTLSKDWVHSMIKAGKRVLPLKIPVVLDPVGAGATIYRTTVARELIENTPITVVRGNPSEILALAGEKSQTKGVDTRLSSKEIVKQAIEFAAQKSIVVAVTGSIDYITDGKRLIKGYNGHPLLRFITGAGCSATAIIGAFLAVEKDPLYAAAFALTYFGLAGEIAAQTASAPGSFQIELLNSLYNITTNELSKRARLAEEQVREKS
jgi:hydroxyethylthiazole kinase